MTVVPNLFPKDPYFTIVYTDSPPATHTITKKADFF